ncbi:MAG: hypothetical protein QXQ14_02530 [Candidatus Aenigmatarchaeota archaeon]
MNKLIKRILVIFSVLFLVSLFFFLMVRTIEKPNISIIKTTSSAKLVALISNESTKSVLEIERIDYLKINYPYISKPKEICLEYMQVFDKNGNLLKESIDKKVCISSEYEYVYGKDIEVEKAEDLVTVLSNPLRVSIKNKFDFPIIAEVYINVKNIAGKECSITRNEILIIQNTSYFFDSYLISPFGNLEYVICQ